MKWTDSEGKQHHDMGTCYCGAHHAFDGSRKIEQERDEWKSLALDMGEALRAVAWKDSAGLCWCPGETEFAVAHPNADHTPRCQVANALLARLDQLGKEQT